MVNYYYFKLKSTFFYQQSATTNNNLSLKICSKNIINIAFLKKKISNNVNNKEMVWAFFPPQQPCQ